jgi:hypothetical protein
MTILAEPPTLVATAPHPAESTTLAADLRQRSTTVRTLAPSRRRQPVDAPAIAQRLLRQRDPLEADDLDRAMARDAAGSEGTVDTWPLRETDPVTVDGYRLVNRLGVGGMADVFYAVARTGRPVAVKILRATDSASEACQREYRLARAVDADCTAPALDHGVSAAGARVPSGLPVRHHVAGQFTARVTVDARISTGPRARRDSRQWHRPL